MVSCFLEGVTLEEAIERKDIYISNLSQLEGISCPDGRYVSILFSCLFSLYFLNNTSNVAFYENIQYVMHKEIITYQNYLYNQQSTRTAFIRGIRLFANQFLYNHTTCQCLYIRLEM